MRGADRNIVVVRGYAILAPFPSQLAVCHPNLHVPTNPAEGLARRLAHPALSPTPMSALLDHLSLSPGYIFPVYTHFVG